MCQPPEITLQGGDLVDSGDGWAPPEPANAASWHDAEHTNVTSQAGSLLLNYGQFQQQQRVAQLAALAGMDSAGGAWSQALGGSAAVQTAAPWSQGLGLTEKLERAAAAAAAAPMNKARDVGVVSLPWAAASKSKSHGAGAGSLPWMARPQVQSFPAVAAGGVWPVGPVLGQQGAGAPVMAGLAPQLVAQGIPLAMAQLGQLDFQNGQQSAEDELDPKKFKRMMSNRASAKRSRQRRQERLDELEIVSAKLQVDNATVQRRLNEANDRIRKFQHENEALQEELRQLRDLMQSKGVTVTIASNADNTNPGTITAAQDSCGANGSTTEYPSADPSSSPMGKGKRRRDENAESRFKGEEYRQQRSQTSSPVTPSSGTTSDSEKGDAEVYVAAAAVGAVKEPHGDELILHHGIGGILDDDLFSHFIDDCFEARILEAKAIGVALPRP